MAEAVSRFEEAFAVWLGVRHAFAFWKGRVAMYAILKALGIGEGDEVILPGYTCVMDVNPVKYLGARSVFVDIEPVTYNVDVGLLEAKITPRTKVIVAQHTYGYPCEMDAIMEIAARHGLPVVEDCCLALGSTCRGKRCGTFGVATYWSFQWNKPFTTGIGGMATTSDSDLAGKIERLCREELRSPPAGAAMMLSAQRTVYRAFIFPRTTAFATSLFRWLTRKGVVVGSSATCEFVPAEPESFFTGMSAGQARAGLRQLRKIEKNLAHRRKMARLYDGLLREAGWDVPQNAHPGPRSASRIGSPAAGRGRSGPASFPLWGSLGCLRSPCCKRRSKGAATFGIRLRIRSPGPYRAAPGRRVDPASAGPVCQPGLDMASANVP